MFDLIILFNRKVLLLNEIYFLFAFKLWACKKEMNLCFSLPHSFHHDSLVSTE